MCKHCARLVEDRVDAPIVHAFFEVLTRASNRKLREQGCVNVLTADDIDIDVRFNGQSPPGPEADALAARIHRLLDELTRG